MWHYFIYKSRKAIINIRCILNPLPVLLIARLTMSLISYFYANHQPNVYWSHGKWPCNMWVVEQIAVAFLPRAFAEAPAKINHFGGKHLHQQPDENMHNADACRCLPFGIVLNHRKDVLIIFVAFLNPQAFHVLRDYVEESFELS